MIDLVPEKDGLYLYGDKSSSIDVVAKFRSSLRSNIGKD